MNITFVMFLLAADPWAVPTVPVNPATAEEPLWVKLAKPLPVIEDAYQDVHQFRCGQTYPDVHEQSHFVMNWFSNSWGSYSKRQQILYCLRNRIIVLDEPPLTLADVAAAVPQDQRGGIYQMYLIDQQPGWNKTPLYILNEAVSYSNEWEWDHTTLGLRNAKEMNGYAAIMADLAERSKGYNAGPLRSFVEWHVCRVAEQERRAVKLPAKQSLPSACLSGMCGRR